MSRHRFLMLGASIVGVGMLQFAQRDYAYAQGLTVTPEKYGDETDPTKHTQMLYEMFTDKRLRAPYRFRLPPNGVTGGWWVDMGSPTFTAFPVKSKWTLTGGAEGATSVDPAAGLYRYGKVVNGRRMFQNVDTKNGNDEITFERVYVNGRKFAAAIEYTIPGSDRTPNPGLAEKTSGDGTTFDYEQHFYDIDTLVTFVRVGGDPNEQSSRWNYDVHFVGCEARDWPGISCELRQVNRFNVSGNRILSSHRGSLIFRIGARYGTVNNNFVDNGGDDCIAFNGNSGFFSDRPNTGGAGNVNLSGNTLGEKEGQDIREPSGINSRTGEEYRRRDGNSPLAIRHAEAGPVNVNNTTVTQTEDGYTDWAGQEHAAQPAVEVRDRQGFTSRNVYIDGLLVQKGIDPEWAESPGARRLVAPALYIPSPGVTGGIINGAIEEPWDGPSASCPWQIAASGFSYTTPDGQVSLDPPEVCVP